MLETAQCFISLPTVALLLLKWLLIRTNYNEEPVGIAVDPCNCNSCRRPVCLYLDPVFIFKDII